MNFLQFLNEIKISNDREVQRIADSHGIHFTLHEIQLLRPLLDELSFSWWFTGIPSSFIQKVEKKVGKDKTNELLFMYDQMKNS